MLAPVARYGWPMNTPRFAVPLLIAALALAGCATTGSNIKPNFQAGTDFSRYHTFAVLPVTTGTGGGQADLKPALAGAARDAAVQALTSKGLSQVGEAQADLLVFISGDAVSSQPTYQHRPAFTSQGVVNVYYLDSAFPQIQTQCDMVVELIDRAASKVVWQAATSDTLMAKPDRQVVALMVKNILGAYPPPTATK